MNSISKLFHSHKLIGRHYQYLHNQLIQLSNLGKSLTTNQEILTKFNSQVDLNPGKAYALKLIIL